MRRPRIILLLPLFAPVMLAAQVETAPVEGLRENTPRVHILTGGTVWTAPGKKLEKGTIILRDGLIERIGGPEIEPPPDARAWDLAGKTVYAGFIDAATTLGEPVEPSGTNTHWNSLVRPERRTAAYSKPSKDDVTALRHLGFAVAHVIPDKGIIRGQSNVASLFDVTQVIAENVYQCIAFERSGGNGYPASLMGSVALVRQTLHDARWHRNLTAYLRDHPETERPESNAALEALAPVVENRQPLLARARDELDYARIARIATELALPNYTLLGNGYEYRQGAMLKESGATVIIPLNFPKAPPVENPAGALPISLEKLSHWERAPSNPAELAMREIPICLSTWELEKPKVNFWKNVRKSVRRGLPPDAALAALTRHPAAALGLSGRLGAIRPGMMASLVVASGDLFTDENAAVHTVWVEGVPFETAAGKRIDLRGLWTMEWNGVEGPATWKVEGKAKSPKLKIGDKDVPIKVEGEKVLLYPEATLFGGDGTARLAGFVERATQRIRGTGHLPGGRMFSWTARTSPAENENENEDENEDEDEDEEEEEEDKDVALPTFAQYPAGAFGVTGNPDQPAVLLVRNATIWTSAEAGRVEHADILVKAGKIAKIGQDLPAEDALVIDATGKHVSPGLIDCHSHSAISRGINEGTHAVTVEVRIGDVVDPTDIALYRELAGGLTTASLLHGSANPMGGQNQVIKLRWGEGADELRFEGAKPGVKFALGENVKQSNWDEPTDRYPQTRMGVEQIMKDTFLAAREYGVARAKARSEKKPHRRDLRLEAALEILNGERIVHIHSYRQDEILMFVRLAQELRFTVGTFQHILEGYKVADALAEIGAGGSSFSDWWAYKFEVYDAIPYNGALLHRAGVVTSFNSDSNELATRLNTEAAKAVKYGGLSEEEALKFVTLNPAKQLRIDGRVGSLELGKDADFVIWSRHPLSSYARAEQTWIDGRKYFDIETDRELREAARSERERLIAKALPERMTALAKKKAKKELGADSDDNAKKPGLLGYLRNGTPRVRCLSTEQPLYHDGFDTHTCTSGNCCAIR